MTLTSPEREEIKVLGELKYLCVPASGLFGSGSGTFSSMFRFRFRFGPYWAPADMK